MLMGSGNELPIADSICRIEAVSRADLLRVAQNITVEVTYFLEGTLAGEEADSDEDDGI